MKIEAPGTRHFFDTVVGLNPNGKVSGLFNFDYGQDNVPSGSEQQVLWILGGHAGSGRIEVCRQSRYDWYKDPDGFITAVAQTMQEFTITADYKLLEGFLSRFEYRRDWSNQPFFDRGNQRASAKSMNTLLAGL